MLPKINTFYKSNLFFLIILIIVVFTIYAPSINYKNTNIDDDYLIEQNITYISQFKNIPNFFTESCYYSKEFPYYRPVLSISFAAEAILFGYNLKVAHTANILYFILSVFCIFLLASKLKFNPSVVKFICLLLAVHPIFMSCPVWIPARNDTLLVIFFTLTLVYFLKFIETNSVKNLCLFILSLTASIFTKETAIILLPVLPAMLYCFGYKISKKQMLKVFVLILPLLTFYFILRQTSITTPDLPSYFTNYKYFLNVSVTGLSIYIYKFIIPDYLPLIVNNLHLTPKLLTTNIILLILLVVFFYTKFIRTKTIFFAAIWFILSLLPTFFITNYALLFHRFLTPSVAVVIILAELTGKIISVYPVSKKYLTFLFVMLFLIFALNSHIYSSRFKNAESFWANAFIDSPDYTETLHGFTRVLIAAGNYTKAKEIMNEYAPKFKYYNFILNLGNILTAEKKYDEAEKLFLEALKNKNEKYIEYLYCLNLSNIYLYKMDFAKSIEFAKKSSELAPHNTSPFIMLSKIYAVRGEYQKAVDILLFLLKNDKRNLSYLENLALLYEDLNDKPNAEKYAGMILKTNPDNAIAADVLKKIKS